MSDEPNSAALMDAAAAKAGEDLSANITHWTATELARWWADNYLAAGHKRLGRLLVKEAK